VLPAADLDEHVHGRRLGPAGGSGHRLPQAAGMSERTAVPKRPT
jgi:hypothetical protein